MVNSGWRAGCEGWGAGCRGGELDVGEGLSSVELRDDT